MLCFGMEIGSDPLLMELRASLLVVQIDGLHVSDDLVLVAAIGIDGQGGKHPLAVVEGATENTETVQALLDNLIERGLDPAVPRLFRGCSSLTARRPFPRQSKPPLGRPLRSRGAKSTRPETVRRQMI